MKVLKEGKWKQQWEAKVVCHEAQCGAELLVEESDLKAVDYSSRNDFCAVCAVCGSRLVFPEKEIPLRLQKMLNAKRAQSCSSDW